MEFLTAQIDLSRRVIMLEEGGNSGALVGSPPARVQLLVARR